MLSSNTICWPGNVGVKTQFTVELRLSGWLALLVLFSRKLVWNEPGVFTHHLQLQEMNSLDPVV